MIVLFCKSGSLVVFNIVQNITIDSNINIYIILYFDNTKFISIIDCWHH